MDTYLLTSSVTLATMILFFWVSLRVGLARGKYSVKAPAVTGCVEFECFFRVQQNTLEQTVFFLPSLWMFALFQNDLWAAAIGGVWLAGRVLYAISYTRAPEKRGLGFSVSMLASVVLLVGAVVGLLPRLGS